jgi:glutathione transport system substrate-binding protein
VEADRRHEGEEVRRLLEEGLSEDRHDHWKPVVDNNTRAALMQTGEADFAFTIPFEQAADLKNNPKVDLIERPSIIQRYISLNTQKKPFDNPKVREALNYAINKEALAKVVFAGYATPQTGVAPVGVEYATKLGPWPYDPAKARAAEGGRLSERLRVDAVVRLQPHDRAEGDPVRPAAVGAGRRQGAGAGARGRRAGREGRGAQDPATAPVRMYYSGWSSSTGEANWALSPLLASTSAPPKLYNTAYYKNAAVDDDLSKALETTDNAKKATLYADAQKQVWADAPWIFLVPEKIVYARKRLHGIYVMPDGSFNFDEISVK